MISVLSLLALASTASARELHVAITGDDGADGSAAHPLRTVQRGAQLSQSGDTVTVHAGMYRERVHPPTGGVTFQAAAGEAVTLSGAEPVGGWELVGTDTWRTALPSGPFFGNFNPYSDRIRGDWFDPEGLVHHTGAVYQADTWLSEAASLADVLKPLVPGAAPVWFATVDSDTGAYLVNLLSIAPRGGGAAISAGAPSWRYGTKPYNGTEGPCAAFIMTGDLLRFDGVDFGAGTTELDIRAAAATGAGATLEIHAGDRWGPLLGSVAVPSTGDWMAWQNFSVPITRTAGLQMISVIFLAPGYAAGNTTIYAQFPAGVDPNAAAAAVEINVRQTVLYPDAPFIDNVTVRGFTLERAATQWAPPSAEQNAIVGTHWSRGWVIEQNEVRQAACSCVSLGKYGDGYDNTNDAGQADPYTACVRRALNNGWHKDRIGSHTVRGNYIHECGQTGIVGSLGGAFSVITQNRIHDCHWQRTFSGAEMAGIKLHAAIDVVGDRSSELGDPLAQSPPHLPLHTLVAPPPPLFQEIEDNHIYRSDGLGIWLDWMAQGARVIGNLFHDNADCNIFTEVDHGPYVMANNLFLGGPSGGVCANSAGGAYVHNLIAGAVQHNGADGRLTPVLVPHATDIAQMVTNNNGDHRLYNNVLVAPAGFAAVNNAVQPCVGGGNVFTGAASPGPSKFENSSLVEASFSVGLNLTQEGDAWFLSLTLDPRWQTAVPRALVTTELLGNATVPQQPYTLPDGSAFAIDRDYLGRARSAANPYPGPFEASGPLRVQVWPK